MGASRVPPFATPSPQEKGRQTTLLSNKETAVTLRIQQMTASGSLIETLGGGGELRSSHRQRNLSARYRKPGLNFFGYGVKNRPTDAEVNCGRCGTVRSRPIVCRTGRGPLNWLAAGL